MLLIPILVLRQSSYKNSLFAVVKVLNASPSLQTPPLQELVITDSEDIQ
jgi:hypothetical protein